MIVRLAIGNVRASLRDFSVYFATLACAACLLYAFTASTDYLSALDLTDAQRASIAQAGGILQGFSVFSVVVFSFLVGYANRFLVRRRKREFALYALLGMGSGRIGLVLAAESALVGATSLAFGIAAGTAASPLFGAAAANVFGVPWRPALTFSPGAAEWTACCFAVIAAAAAIIAVRDVRARPLAELMHAARTPERPRGRTNRGMRAHKAAAVALLSVVWGSCVFAPGAFIAFIVPMGFAAVFATHFVFRILSARIARAVRRRPERFWRGLAPFTWGRIEAKVESSCTAMACVCVLVAAAVCMMCAGVAFTVGVRAAGNSTLLAENIAPIGYIGIFYGATFLVAAAAVLAIQQLSDAAYARKEYRFLAVIGAPEADMRRSVRTQVALYFAAPCAFAFAHDAFGLALVALLAFAVGSTGFGGTVLAVMGATTLFMAAYAALTSFACERALVEAPWAGAAARP